MKKFINSIKYAISGVIQALKEEKNLKIDFFIMILVIIFSVIFKISKLEWVIELILFGIVISLELINTSIERTVDLIIKEKNKDAKFIKDVAAGASFVSAIVAFIIGLMIYIPKIFK